MVVDRGRSSIHTKESLFPSEGSEMWGLGPESAHTIGGFFFSFLETELLRVERSHYRQGIVIPENNSEMHIE